MAQPFIVAQLVSNRLPEITAALRPKASEIVRRTAMDILANAEANLPNPDGRGVDTGNLKDSYQVGDPDNVFEMKPGDTEAVVGTSVEYAPYVEMGTSRMAAIPHLTPAAEKVRPGFEQAMKKLVE